MSDGLSPECNSVRRSNVIAAHTVVDTRSIGRIVLHEKHISMTSNLARRAGGAIVAATLCTALVLAQSAPSPVGPLRTAPIEKLTVNPGFRDWGPTTIVGTTILAGNVTG